MRFIFYRSSVSQVRGKITGDSSKATHVAPWKNIGIGYTCDEIGHSEGEI